MADSYDPRAGGDPQRPVPRYGQYGSGTEGTGQGSPWHAQDTQPIPPAGEHPGATGGYQYGTYSGGQDGYTAASQPVGGAATATTPKRKFSAGALVAGMVLAGLIGAGTAVGTGALAENNGVSAAGNSSPVIVNNTESVNQITGATHKASPSW